MIGESELTLLLYKLDIYSSAKAVLIFTLSGGNADGYLAFVLGGL